MAKPKKQSMPVTRAQIKHIHALVTKIGFPDAVYRKALKYGYGVETSKLLSIEQAANFISVLRDIAIAEGLINERKLKYSELGMRYGMATPAQLRKIEAMWSGVSRQETPKKKEQALRKFLENKFGVSDIRFIEARQVRKIIHGLRHFKPDPESSIPSPLRGEGEDGGEA